MTTLAYRDGVLAADSRTTYLSEAGGTRIATCEKLYRLKDAIVGICGESAPGLVFLDWYKSRKKVAPLNLIDGDADFLALVLTRHGLFEFDRWCRGEKVLDKFHAAGSGAKAALGAMHMGASAERSVEVACLIDPYSAPPIITMTLD